MLADWISPEDPNPNWKMYVDAKWPSDPLLKLV
jgi:hypothetical protein